MKRMLAMETEIPTTMLLGSVYGIWGYYKDPCLHALLNTTSRPEKNPRGSVRTKPSLLSPIPISGMAS